MPLRSRRDRLRPGRLRRRDPRRAARPEGRGVEDDRLGGVCLNWGCIPSQGAADRRRARRDAAQHGETFGVACRRAAPRLRQADRPQPQGRRSPLQGRAVAVQEEPDRVGRTGAAASRAPTTVEVTGRERAHDRGRAHPARDGLRPSGRRRASRRRRARAHLARGARSRRACPSKLIVIGAGAVGLEFAYVYAMYGAKVTVVEMATQMLPGADPEVAAVLAARVHAARTSTCAPARASRS